MDSHFGADLNAAPRFHGGKGPAKSGELLEIIWKGAGRRRRQAGVAEGAFDTNPKRKRGKARSSLALRVSVDRHKTSAAVYQAVWPGCAAWRAVTDPQRPELQCALLYRHHAD